LDDRLEELLSRPEIEEKPRPADYGDTASVDVSSLPEFEKLDIEVPVDVLLQESDILYEEFCNLFESLCAWSPLGSGLVEGSVPSDKIPSDEEYRRALAESSLDRLSSTLVDLWENTALRSGDIPRLLASNIAYCVTYLSDFLAFLKPEIMKLREEGRFRSSRTEFDLYWNYVSSLESQLRTARGIRNKIDTTLELLTLDFQETILDSLFVGFDPKDLDAAYRFLSGLRALLYVAAASKIGAWRQIAARFKVQLRQRMRREILFRLWYQIDQYFSRIQEMLYSNLRSFRRLLQNRALQGLLREVIDELYVLRKKRDALIAGIWSQNQAAFEILDSQLDVTRSLAGIASVLRVLERVLEVLESARRSGGLPSDLKVQILNRLRGVSPKTSETGTSDRTNQVFVSIENWSPPAGWWDMESSFLNSFLGKTNASQ
jgi:hypothetical protein